MIGLTFVSMAVHEMTKYLADKTEEEDKIPSPSSMHEPDFVGTSLPAIRPPRYLLRHRHRRARNRAYARNLLKSLPDELKF